MPTPKETINRNAHPELSVIMKTQNHRTKDDSGCIPVSGGSAAVGVNEQKLHISK